MAKSFCKLAFFISVCSDTFAKISHDSNEIKDRQPRWAILNPEFSEVGSNPMFWWSTWIKFFFGLYLAVMYAQFLHRSKQVGTYDLY